MQRSLRELGWMQVKTIILHSFIYENTLKITFLFFPDTTTGIPFPTLPLLFTVISSVSALQRYLCHILSRVSEFPPQDDEPTVALVMGGRHPGHYFMDKDDFNDIVTRTEVCPVQIKVS